MPCAFPASTPIEPASDALASDDHRATVAPSGVAEFRFTLREPLARGVYHLQFSSRADVSSLDRSAAVVRIRL